MSRPRSRGFTLLEVLAAVALLAILYTTLAGVAIQGLRAEGEAQRLLEASLLADEQLAEIETVIASGGAPPVGRSESEHDLFLVSVNVAPVDLALLLPGDAAAAEGEGQSLLSGADGSPVSLIEVVVSWREGVGERSTTRTTYAFDPLVVADLLGAAGALPGQPGAETTR